MATLQDLMQKGEGVLSTVLAADRPELNQDAADGTGRIDFDDHNRTILIGLGGTGVKTVDYVKGVLTSRLKAGSDKYIGYLAIDTDWKELSQMKHLTPSECVPTTLEDVGKRVHKEDYADWVATWRPFLSDELARQIKDMHLPGAGQNRVSGRVKMHDKCAYAAVDNTIEGKIGGIKGKLAGLVGSGRYVVYVIGSIFGGTGSGGLLEMPAIIRKALGTDAVDINAVLYLPDTVTGNCTIDDAKKLNANAYAFLRELNYYQAVRMRDGYSEQWSLNSQKEPFEIEVPNGADKHFFSVPYLIGSPTGGVDAEAIARSTIGEFLVSILGKIEMDDDGVFMLDSFRSNVVTQMADKLFAADGEHEMSGSAHEFPKCYATIGFAKAAAPKKVIQSYVIADACVKAGLKPISPEEREAQKAAGEEFLPFTGPEDYVNADVGNQEAKQILEPILNFMHSYTDGGFNYVQECGALPWEDLVGQKAAAGIRGQNISKYIRKKTEGQTRAELERKAAEAVKEYRQNVRDYVAQEGPYAFANLFYGKFTAPAADDPRIGIEKILTWLKEGKDEDGNPIEIAVEDKAKRAQAALDEAVRCNGIKGFFKGLLGKKEELIHDWVTAENAYVNEQIKAARYKIMTGSNAVFENEIEMPLATLAQQTLIFAQILKVMNDTYTEEASKLENFNAFQNVSDGAAAVNIAALDQNAYNWIKRKAEAAAEAVAGNTIRDKLVQSFFENPRAWTEYDEVLVKTDGTIPKLKNADRPIEARGLFDECVVEGAGKVPEVKIQDLVSQVVAKGVSLATFADRVVKELGRQGAPLINGGVVGTGNVHMYVVIPSELKTSAANKPIADAIEAAVKTNLGNNVKVYSSASSDSITLYRQVSPFEIYNLASLGSWEADYRDTNPVERGLHGLSPDSAVVGTEGGNPVYAEKLNWYRDYPFITYQRAPQTPGAMKGSISAEGQRRKRFDETIDKAKELGVLYAKKNINSGLWNVYRVSCDKSRVWSLDTTQMVPGENGLYPTGADLVPIIAAQNGVTVDQISRAVMLHEGGLFAKTGYSTEAIAWECASRVLYSHIPMFCEVRNTLSVFEPWLKEIQMLNEELMKILAEDAKNLVPAKLIRLIQAHQLYKDSHDFWHLDYAGKDIIVCKLDATSRKLLNVKNAKMNNCINAGFVFYYIATEFQNLFADKKPLANVNSVDAMNTLMEQVESYFAAASDEEQIEQDMASAEAFLAESATLVDKGAVLENTEWKPTAAFKKAMTAMRIAEPEMLGILDCYRYALQWDTI